MNKITPEALEFLEEAKKSFEENPQQFTYLRKEKGFIALRTGFNESMLDIYELGDEVGSFTDLFPSRYTVTILDKELEDLKKQSKIIDNIKNIISFYDNSPIEHTVEEVLASIRLQVK